MEYYAIINGIQSGPLRREDLRMAGVQPSTFVWRQGMADWAKAETLPELADIFIDDSAFGSYARPEESVNPYAGQNPYAGRPPHYNQAPVYGYGYNDPRNQFQGEPIPHTNWLAWAVVGTVFGAFFSCIGMIFGIIGIVKANAANRWYNDGFRENGDMNNSTARTMTIIALVLGGIGFLLTVTGVTSTLVRNFVNIPM